MINANILCLVKKIETTYTFLQKTFLRPQKVINGHTHCNRLQNKGKLFNDNSVLKDRLQFINALKMVENQ